MNSGPYDQFWAILCHVGPKRRWWAILGPLSNFGPFWALFGTLGHFGHSGPFWAILGTLGHFGHFGLFWAILGTLGTLGHLGPFWATGPFWAILSHFGPSGPFWAILGHFGFFGCYNPVFLTCWNSDLITLPVTAQMHLGLKWTALWGRIGQILTLNQNAGTCGDMQEKKTSEMYVASLPFLILDFRFLTFCYSTFHTRHSILDVK